MLRQIEIDPGGTLSEVGEGYIECPIQSIGEAVFCHKRCAWIQTIEYTTGARNSNRFFCGDKLIGEIKEKK